MRIGQVDHNHVEKALGGLHETAAIGHVYMHSYIGFRRGPFLAKVAARDFEDGRIELHVIHAFERAVLERLPEASVGPAADQQKAARGRVFEQRIVDGFLGPFRIGRVKQNQPVLIDAARPFGFHHRKVAVSRVPRG